MEGVHVSGLAVTPVKATRLQPVAAVQLTPDGARGDRSFYVIDDRAQMVNGKRFGELQTVVAHYDPATEELSLQLPDRGPVAGTVRYGKPVRTRFHSHPRRARLVEGPWAEALSEFLGQPLRLVADGSAVDRGRRAGISLMSRASLARLAQELDEESFDGRRFRMLIEIDGVGAHEEDQWMGRRVRLGSALAVMRGHVGRCMVTTRNPETGAVDARTLHGLSSYRGEEEADEPLPFGVYGEVLEEGTVRVGDPVALEG